MGSVSRFWGWALGAVLVMVLLTSGGCGILGIGNPTLRTFEVAPHKGSCFGLFATLCLQVREPGETDFGNLYETPVGFDYEWGFAYVIQVEEHDVENPPADGSSIRRVLRKIIAKTPTAPGSTFELTLVGGSGIRSLGDDLYSLFSGPQQMVCAGSEECAELGRLVMEQSWMRITLAHPPDRQDPFPITAWALCADQQGPC
jgi:hypothetical protein